jgi:predicted aspartyl protease
MRSIIQNRNLLALVLMAPLFLHGQEEIAHSARIDLRNGLPFVRILINGRGPFSFVFDTATTGRAIVSQVVASELGLKTEGKATLNDLQGGSEKQLDAVKLASLSVAGVEIDGVKAMVKTLPGSARHYDGIVGLGLFRDYLVTLDFPHRQIQLKKGALSMEKNRNVLSCQSDVGVPTILLRFQGHEVEGTIDTGAQGLIIPESLAKDLSLLGLPESIGLDETLVERFQVQRARMAGSIELATFRFDRPHLWISPGVRTTILGMETFRDFSLTIDQRNQLVQFWSQKAKHVIGHSPMNKDLRIPADNIEKAVMRTGAPY